MSKKRKPFTTPHVKEKFEYTEYESGLNDYEKWWIEQFYQEYYNDGVSFTNEDDRILNTEEMVKDARRNHNVNKRDAFEVATKKHDIIYLGNAFNNQIPVDHEMEYTGETDLFMQEMSDDNDWEMCYGMEGFELAAREIIMQAVRDLDNNLVDKTITLMRFYQKMSKLRRMRDADYRKNVRVKRKPKTKEEK